MTLVTNPSELYIRADRICLAERFAERLANDLLNDLLNDDSGRFKVFLDQAVRENRIMTGAWDKRTWISFAVLSRLVSSFLTHTIQQGTRNWYLPIAKCLSVVLVAALGARPGDVARSYLYTGQEYLRFRNIHLHVVGTEATFANLRATITLEFQRGFEEKQNAETEHFLTPVTTPEHLHMCPLIWPLIHALRHSLVAGGAGAARVARAGKDILCHVLDFH